MRRGLKTTSSINSSQKQRVKGQLLTMVAFDCLFTAVVVNTRANWDGCGRNGEDAARGDGAVRAMITA